MSRRRRSSFAARAHQGPAPIALRGRREARDREAEVRSLAGVLRAVETDLTAQEALQRAREALGDG